ncbi:MAG: DUF1559 domain-containing protein [Pirellula sp.]
MSISVDNPTILPSGIMVRIQKMRLRALCCAKMLVFLIVCFSHQSGMAQGDVEQVLALLERHPESSRATGRIIDHSQSNEIAAATFEYRRIREDICFVKTFSSGERSVVMVKDGMLHSFRLRPQGNDSRPFLYRQGRLTDPSWQSYENAIIGGGLVVSDLVLIDPEFRRKFDGGGLIRKVVSEKKRRLNVSESDGGVSVTIGADGNEAKVTLTFDQNGHIREVGQFFDRYESRQQFGWQGDRLHFVREEIRDSPDGRWVATKEVAFNTWEPNADVAFTLEEHGIRKQRYYLPVAILVPLIGLVTMLSVYGFARRRAIQENGQSVRLGTRKGITLIEVIVAMTILTLLAALGLPAVHAIREGSRLTSCKNNSRQIGAALITHEAIRKSFPSCGWGYRWYSLSDRSNEGQPGGWMYHILPYIEQQSLYSSTPSSLDLRMQRVDLFRNHGQVVVSLFHCPSKFSRDRFKSHSRMVFGDVDQCVRPDYALSGGTSSQSGGWPGPETIEEAESSNFAWPMEIDMGIARRRYTRKCNDISDGLSNTILLGEKKVACSEARNSTGYESNPDDQPYLAGLGQDNVRWTGLISRPLDGAFFGLMLENDCTDGSSTVFGGPHPGLTVFVRCDGSVFQVSNTIDRLTFARLGHICDGEYVETE